MESMEVIDLGVIAHYQPHHNLENFMVPDDPCKLELLPGIVDPDCELRKLPLQGVQSFSTSAVMRTTLFIVFS